MSQSEQGTIYRPDWLSSHTLDQLKQGWQATLADELAKPTHKQRAETIARYRLRVEIAEQLQSGSRCAVHSLQSARDCADHIVANVINHFLMLWRSLAPKTVASQ